MNHILTMTGMDGETTRYAYDAAVRRMVVLRVMRKFYCGLVEIYYGGRLTAPWLLFSGQGAKCQGWRKPLVLSLTFFELTATYSAIISCSMASRGFIFMCFLLPHWVPATCRSWAQTSIKAEFPSGKALTILILRRSSRFIRSITLLVRIFSNALMGNHSRSGFLRSHRLLSLPPPAVS